MKVQQVTFQGRKKYQGWLEEKYKGHWCQLSTDTTFKAKLAIRDVIRAIHGKPEDAPRIWYRVDELTKKIVPPPQGVDDKKFILGYESEDGHWVKGTSEPGHENSDSALIAFINEFYKEWEIVLKVLGLARGKSLHASAYLLSNIPIDEFVPLTTIGDVRASSFTAGPVEAIGGIKMDFLRINSLEDIQQTLTLIRQRQGVEAKDIVINGLRVPGHHTLPKFPGSKELVSIWDLPEDVGVFESISSGKNETVFQFNTNAARIGMRHFNFKKDGLPLIRAVKHLAVFTALNRPGPLDFPVQDPEHPDKKHNMLVEYARRFRGAVGSQDVLPIMEELVPETLGVLTFQESLERVYKNLTDCTGPQAEEFRKNVAKKKKEKVDAAYSFFMERVTPKLGEENSRFVFDSLKTFGRYGFNASHAYSYAVTAYACAYLKFHYPLEWWCGVLKNAKKDEINETFWAYCSNLLLLPDVKASGANWEIQGDKIRAPLDLLHGIGETVHSQIVSGAPYNSIQDFVKKIVEHQKTGAIETTKTKETKKLGVQTIKVVKPGRSAINRTHVYKLIVSGAMDSLFNPGTTIEEMLSAFDEAMDEEYTKAFGKKKSGKKKVFQPLTPLTRYQLRKSILPAYGLDLRPLITKEFPDNSPLSIVEKTGGKILRYKHSYFNPKTKQMVDCDDPVIGIDRFQLMDAAPIPPGGLNAAVIAYVESSEPFTYGPNKTKRALRLTLEIGGVKYKTVCWPPRTGIAPNLEKGSIVAALFNRYTGDKLFSMKEFFIIKSPYNESDDEQSS